MTSFFGVNSLCEIDTLFWCQNNWCHCDTKNSVTVTPNLVLQLHFSATTTPHAMYTSGVMQACNYTHLSHYTNNFKLEDVTINCICIQIQHDIAQVILLLMYVTVYTYISKQSMMWMQNLKMKGDKVTWTRRNWLTAHLL